MMTDGYSVDLAALRHDAARFAQWSAQFTAIASAAPDLAGASGVPGALGVLDAYRDAVAALHELAAAEAAECDAFADRLTKTVRLYVDAEEQTTQDVASLSTELESL
jgi:hypothetical protein